MSMIYEYDLNNYKQIEFLRQNLYPTLEKALDILIEHIIKTNEVQNHQERLKQQRIQDRMEQKRIEKEKLKEELGSDYESSNDDDIFDDMSPHEEEQKSLSQQFAKDIPDQKKIIEQGAKEEEGSQLAQIVEDEKEEAGDEPVISRPLKSVNLLRNMYDPLDHLSKLLREMNQKK